MVKNTRLEISKYVILILFLKPHSVSMYKKRQKMIKKSKTAPFWLRLAPFWLRLAPFFSKTGISNF